MSSVGDDLEDELELDSEIGTGENLEKTFEGDSLEFDSLENIEEPPEIQPNGRSKFFQKFW